MALDPKTLARLPKGVRDYVASLEYGLADLTVQHNALLHGRLVADGKQRGAASLCLGYDTKSCGRILVALPPMARLSVTPAAQPHEYLEACHDPEWARTSNPGSAHLTVRSSMGGVVVHPRSSNVVTVELLP